VLTTTTPIVNISTVQISVELPPLGGSRAGRDVMPKRVIIPKNAQPPIAPYSPGIRAGKTIYTSGCGPIDSAGKTVGTGDVRAQTKSVLDAIKGIVEAGGGTLSDVTFNQIFLKNLADYQAMNEVYKTYFPTEPPARYCIRADLVRPDWLVEIASIAHVGDD
jgi:aminoacrylate peracid reductase